MTPEKMKKVEAKVGSPSKGCGAKSRNCGCKKKGYAIDLAASAQIHTLTVTVKTNKIMVPKIEFQRTLFTHYIILQSKRKGSETESCGSKEENIMWKINN